MQCAAAHQQVAAAFTTTPRRRGRPVLLGLEKARCYPVTAAVDATFGLSDVGGPSAGSDKPRGR